VILLGSLTSESLTSFIKLPCLFPSASPFHGIPKVFERSKSPWFSPPEFPHFYICSLHIIPFQSEVISWFFPLCLNGVVPKTAQAGPRSFLFPFREFLGSRVSRSDLFVFPFSHFFVRLIVWYKITFWRTPYPLLEDAWGKYAPSPHSPKLYPKNTQYPTPQSKLFTNLSFFSVIAITALNPSSKLLRHVNSSQIFPPPETWLPSCRTVADTPCPPHMEKSLPDPLVFFLLAVCFRGIPFYRSNFICFFFFDAVSSSLTVPRLMSAFQREKRAF